MPFRHAVSDVGMRSMNLVHRIVLVASGGRLLNRVAGMPAVELHTVGRKSGRPRTNLLTAPIFEDDRIVLVASKGGDDRDPEWLRNLVVSPDVEIRNLRTGETRKVRGRLASPEEKSELWPLVVAAYRGYAGYQKRTTRDIPLVICESGG
jgi:deazaflavin-dependent oxidoreductase (nitroreductase family)